MSNLPSAATDPTSSVEGVLFLPSTSDEAQHDFPPSLPSQSPSQPINDVSSPPNSDPSRPQWPSGFTLFFDPTSERAVRLGQELSVRRLLPRARSSLLLPFRYLLSFLSSPPRLTICSPFPSHRLSTLPSLLSLLFRWMQQLTSSSTLLPPLETRSLSSFPPLESNTSSRSNGSTSRSSMPPGNLRLDTSSSRQSEGSSWMERSRRTRTGRQSSEPALSSSPPSSCSLLSHQAVRSSSLSNRLDGGNPVLEERWPASEDEDLARFLSSLDDLSALNETGQDVLDRYVKETVRLFDSFLLCGCRALILLRSLFVSLLNERPTNAGSIINSGETLSSTTESCS